jgi:hypothetical protein
MVCHDENGRIGEVFSGFREVVTLDVGEKLVVEVEENAGEISPEEQYVANGEIVERPAMDLGVSGNVITRIPKGATLRIGDQAYTVNDGHAEIEGYSGAVKITCWPYQDTEVQI